MGGAGGDNVKRKCRSAGSLADEIDGDFAKWNCGGRIAAGGAGGSTDIGEWRKRGGCGNSHERDDGRGRSNDERHRRRLFAIVYDAKAEQALRIKCQRVGAKGLDD